MSTPSKKTPSRTRQKSTRNFGIGSRDLTRAGKLFVHGSLRSFSTKGTVSDRWKVFSDWAKDELGITKMESITQEVLIKYGGHLKNRIDRGELQASTAQFYVSAVNSIMQTATKGHWESVSPTKDCGIPKRNHLPKMSKAMPESRHHQIAALVSERIAVMMGLQRLMGLRFKESALIDPRRALRQALSKGHAVISSGTKGGRKRNVPVNADAKTMLERAVKIQNGRSLIPKEMTFVEFRRECYATALAQGFSFHPERHHYAQRRYQELVGVPAPINTTVPRKQWIEYLAEFLGLDKSVAAEIDKAARLRISEELGHGRVEVTRVYLG